MFLGAIADDLTGATDLSLTLSRGGLRTLQVTGVPKTPIALDAIDAVVVALKSRTIPAPEAVEMSLAALEWLRRQGVERFFFKYCSTFDSTDEGNIGPVAEALMQRLGERFSIACPAFPANGRSVYQGHLFVKDVLLSDSPMRDHPLTPMRDSDLRRVLAAQMRGAVGHVAWSDVSRGAEAIAGAFRREADAGKTIAIVDAVSDDDLRAMGEAGASLRLLTGGSGLAIGLPEAYRAAGLIGELHPPAQSFEAPPGRRVALSGSCSAATREQVERAKTAGAALFRIEPAALADGTLKAEAVLEWLGDLPHETVPLIYSSAEPDVVRQTQRALGGEGAAGDLVERFFADLAGRLPAAGFTRIIVAGGETSGAAVAGLGVEALEIGPEIDPGVPWTRARGGPDCVLALKSGNFGAPDFFLKAWDILA